tara:strand:+ start:1609 stop:2049 length:441 start_codon:yes stop_codon:yes gene_type:complete
MAGTLTVDNANTDTIAGKSNANNMTINAGNITIKGEGTATTNLQQGLAKSWVKFNGTGTPAAQDSLNFTSLTDNSTGYYTVVLTNPMTNTNYCRSGSVGEGVNSGANRILGLRVPSTANFNVATYNTSGGINDNADNCCLAHGDLA